MVRGVLFVIGMHRSGTSFLAGLVKLAGLERLQGREIRARPGNPRGFGETFDFTRINNALLAELGGNWRVTPAFEPPLRLEDVSPFIRGRAISLLATNAPLASWYWKDPRLCLTLPFWLPLIPEEDRVAIVFVYRHPIEVAASLRSRNQIAIPMGLAIWESYIRHGLKVMDGLPTYVIEYSAALSDPHSYIKAVREWIQARGIALTGPGATTEVDSWADQSVRHHRATNEDVLSISQSQAELVSLIRRLDGPNDRFAAPELPPATAWAEALMDQHRQLHAAHKELARSREQLLSRRAARLGAWARQRIRMVLPDQMTKVKNSAV